MTATGNSMSAPPTVREALSSAFGYFSVAVACTWAGYATGHQRLVPQYSEWPAYILFLTVLFPPYVNRGILYELKLTEFGNQQFELAWLRSFSIHVPIVLFLQGVGLGTLLFVYTRSEAGIPLVRLAVRIAVTAAPMYVIGARLSARWPKDDSLFGFVHRSFFPAFATCLTPFVFGYAGYGDTKCCVWSAGCVLLLWGISLRVSTSFLFGIGAVCLSLLAIQQLLWINVSTGGWRCAQVIFFGILMTLTMGVSQAWRVTKRVQCDAIFRNAGPFTSREKSFYAGGTNLASALFLPCFLLTALHPSTKKLYLMTILLLVTIQYCCWFIQNIHDKIPWLQAGIFSGLLLPVIVAFETQFPRTANWQGELVPFAVDFSTLITVVTVNGAMFGSLTIAPARNIKKREVPPAYRFVSHLEPPVPCVCITGIVSAVLSSVFVMLAHYAPISDIEKPRMAALEQLYLYVAMVCAALVWGITIYDGEWKNIS